MNRVKSILVLMFAFLTGMLEVQPVVAQVDRYCGTDEVMREIIKNDPGYFDRMSQLENFTKEYVDLHGQQRSAGTIQYIIPVVFHVIHTYGAENISKAQVLDAVDAMNKSFQKLFADSSQVVSAFQSIHADAEIEFRLAQLDPSGNCTDGITRTYSALTHDAGDNVKALIKWPYNKYFNIWVVANIASGAAGYAYMPGSNNSNDGVVIRHDYTGYIGSNPGSLYNGRALSHEAGHWLNLRHTWGGTNNAGLATNCNDDDLVQDTPNTIGVQGVCNTNQVTCGSLDNVQNYMDYAGCPLMFTQGQKTRMHAALNSGFGSRNNLHISSNLLATGTNDGFVPSPCTPVADLNPAIKYICTGTSVTFTDNSWRGDVTNWQWDFPGGTPASSNDTSPVIQYNTPGIYDVTITVSNAAGSSSITRNGIVVVSDGVSPTAVPFLEDFENTGGIPAGANWVVENATGNGWALTNSASVSGSQSIRLVNHTGNSQGTTDAFITPTYNLTNITNASMTFKLAYAIRASTSTDQLRVLASNNCGQQWNVRYNKSGQTLATAGLVSAYFTPTPAQWRTETVSINTVAYNNKPSVRFKFEYNHDTGNNMYVDDINITGTPMVGIQDVEFLSTLSLHPNPSSVGTTASFGLSKASRVTVTVMDISGRIVEIPFDGYLQPGNHNYPFGEKLTAGVYMVRFVVDGGQLTERVILTR